MSTEKRLLRPPPRPRTLALDTGRGRAFLIGVDEDGRDRLRVLVASAGGLGLLPGAPGTYAALLAVAFYFAAALGLPEPGASILLAAAFLGACAATVIVGPWAERHWNRADPQQVVLDEVAGLLLVVLCYRVGSAWQVGMWGFLAARLFDMVKPFPARRCERLPHGWGILLDDLVSSLYAIGFLYALAALSGPLGFRSAFWPTGA